MLTLLATLKVKPGTEDKLCGIFAQLTPSVRKEPGNKRYDLLRSVAEPSTFVALEQYDDAAALDAHTASDHFKSAWAEIVPLLDGRPALLRFQEP